MLTLTKFMMGYSVSRALVVAVVAGGTFSAGVLSYLLLSRFREEGSLSVRVNRPSRMPNASNSTPSTVSSANAEPLAGFYPKTLPDQSWGAEFSGDTSSLPLVLDGRRIRVSPKRGQPWTAAVTEVLGCDAERVLVRHSGRPINGAVP